MAGVLDSIFDCSASRKKNSLFLILNITFFSLNVLILTKKCLSVTIKLNRYAEYYSRQGEFRKI